MPKLERLREELSIQKQLFYIAIAVVLATIGGIVRLDIETNKILMAAGVVVSICFCVFCYTRVRIIKRLLQQIEDE